MRRASGLTRVSLVSSSRAACPAGAGAGCGAKASPADAASPGAGEGASPSASSASTSPMATVSPSRLLMARSTPSAGATTSIFTFSVSSSTTGSPAETRSPSCLSHWPTVASTMDSPSAGTLISTDMLPPAHCALCLPRPLAVAYCCLHNPRLLRGMRLRLALGRAGAFRPARVVQPYVPRQQRLESGCDKAPGSHVARLLLHPQHFAQLRETAQSLLESRRRERIQLLHPHDGNCFASLAQRVARGR